MDALDPAVCYRALVARDARFDGRLFVGVTSTGVFCRPVCPARTPKAGNCQFFVTAAAAHAAGFRPCLRCRPETAPEQAAWLGTSKTVSRGLELIAAGALDGDDANVEQLAERLGVGERHLRRLFEQHLGASPVAVTQTRRVLFAKQLIHETRLPMHEIALASGFGSVRRFNEAFQALYQKPPSALRRRASAPEESSAGGVTVRLRYRPPYDWARMLEFFRARAIDGVEWADGERYVRTLRAGGEVCSVELRHAPEAESVEATIRAGSVALLPRVIGRIRRALDLASDAGSIEAHLSRDPVLAPLVAARPGLRAPGGWDGFELAVRAVLGQQVSVEAARRLCSRLVRRCGTQVSLAPELTWVFPTPAQVAAADLSELGVPGARARTLIAVAEAARADVLCFEAAADVEHTVERLRQVRGIGEWTAHYIALRAAREPDAFPASDRGILRGMALASGADVDAARLNRHAESWRPFRGYAAQHLWAADAAARESLKPARCSRSRAPRRANEKEIRP